MASLEQRYDGRWRVVFRHAGRKGSFSLGQVGEQDARAHLAAAEELLRLLGRGMLTLPDGCPVEDFLLHRGRPPARAAAGQAPAAPALTLGGLRDAYLAAMRAKLADTNLDGIRLHFRHLARLLGEGVGLPGLTRPALQGYLAKRSEEWIDPDRHLAERARRAGRPLRRQRAKRHPSPATLKKEIVSLRTAWNWGRRHLGLKEEFPGGGLDYERTEESLPFMTWEEAERRVAGGEPAAKVWECLYLRAAEVNELLAWVKERPVSPWVFPMVAFAAHTGARRSEVVRALPADVDLEAGVVTLREKKRQKGKLTTRRVPLTPCLTEVLAAWAARRAAGGTFFCKDDGRAVTPREAHNYLKRAVRVSKWKVLRGWHVFRHSFISALASRGVDQRVIDDLVGHATEQQRRRYRHLYPDIKAQALKDVFG
jgi:integrase